MATTGGNGNNEADREESTLNIPISLESMDDSFTEFWIPFEEHAWADLSLDDFPVVTNEIRLGDPMDSKRSPFELNPNQAACLSAVAKNITVCHLAPWSATMKRAIIGKVLNIDSNHDKWKDAKLKLQTARNGGQNRIFEKCQKLARDYLHSPSGLKYLEDFNKYVPLALCRSKAEKSLLFPSPTSYTSPPAFLPAAFSLVSKFPLFQIVPSVSALEHLPAFHAHEGGQRLTHADSLPNKPMFSNPVTKKEELYLPPIADMEIYNTHETAESVFAEFKHQIAWGELYNPLPKKAPKGAQKQPNPYGRSLFRKAMYLVQLEICNMSRQWRNGNWKKSGSRPSEILNQVPIIDRDTWITVFDPRSLTEDDEDDYGPTEPFKIVLLYPRPFMQLEYGVRDLTSKTVSVRNSEAKEVTIKQSEIASFVSIFEKKLARRKAVGNDPSIDDKSKKTQPYGQPKEGPQLEDQSDHEDGPRYAGDSDDDHEESGDERHYGGRSDRDHGPRDNNSRGAGGSGGTGRESDRGHREGGGNRSQPDQRPTNTKRSQGGGNQRRGGGGGGSQRKANPLYLDDSSDVDDTSGGSRERFVTYGIDPEGCGLDKESQTWNIRGGIYTPAPSIQVAGTPSRVEDCETSLPEIASPVPDRLKQSTLFPGFAFLKCYSMPVSERTESVRIANCGKTLSQFLIDYEPSAGEESEEEQLEDVPIPIAPIQTQVKEEDFQEDIMESTFQRTVTPTVHSTPGIVSPGRGTKRPSEEASEIRGKRKRRMEFLDVAAIMARVKTSQEKRGSQEPSKRKKNTPDNFTPPAPLSNSSRRRVRTPSTSGLERKLFSGIPGSSPRAHKRNNFSPRLLDHARGRTANQPTSEDSLSTSGLGYWESTMTKTTRIDGGYRKTRRTVSQEIMVVV